eukprot:SAG22_NODE_1699_length_3787_cov_60.283623_3_plen_134_part_00
MADVVDLTGEPEVIDLTGEPEAKRQDLSNAPPKLGDDLLDLVYKQLPLREKMRAARVNKGFNLVAKNNMLGEAEGKLKHIVNYYQKRIARPHVSSTGIDVAMRESEQILTRQCRTPSVTSPQAPCSKTGVCTA